MQCKSTIVHMSVSLTLRKVTLLAQLCRAIRVAEPALFLLEMDGAD